MKIRQHKILTRTLLIFFIINFALAAPAAVRERPDLDANVTRDVTAASQKRWDPLDEGGSTNVPKAGDAQPPGAPPPSLDSTGRVQRVPVALSAPTARPPGLWPLSVPPPRTLYLHPWSLPPMLPGPRPLPPMLPGPRPLPPMLPGPRPLPPMLPGPRPLRLLLPAGPLPPPEPDPLPSTSSRRPYRRPRPSVPRPSVPRPLRPLPPVGLPPPPEPDPLPSTSSRRPYRLKPYRPRPYVPRPSRLRQPSAPPPPSTPASQSGPSEDRFLRPPGFSANPDTSSSTGNQPSPGAMQETHSVPSAEPFPPGFWDDIWKDIPSEFRDDFLKDKIKRRISGSDAVHLAQKDPRSRTF